ncbi:ABC transporter substrate-binding protein [Ilumatobacter nonamiensis]|uniref:ABC transporter substrate-binding protein n=1 Tax=Ilumatobacter nonamiensis TaxID=467093 RepID=UPI00034A6F11|nr:iron-siderophore ABC transporter substrate-binding protein [Ilumatobacter nonamiensis]
MIPRNSSTSPIRRSRSSRSCRRLILGLAVATSVGLSACGSDSDSASDDASTADTEPESSAPPVSDATETEATTEPTTTAAASTTTEPAPPTTEVPPAAFPRTVVHAQGETDVPAEPVRIVSLDRSLTDPVLALGLDLAGYTTYQDPDGALPEYFGEALENADDAVWVGDLLEPNLEAIFAAEPDLIVSSRVRHEALYEELSQIAPTVMTESGGGGWKDNLALVAEATGREELADSLVDEYTTRAAAVGAEINEVAASPTISVVRFLGEIRLYQPVSFSGTVLADAGLARPDSQQDQEEFVAVISEEELPLADADWLFYTVYDDPAATDAFSELEQRPLWSSLTAVQEDRARPVLDDLWMSGVGLYGAHAILDDLAATFDVEEA